MGRSLTYLFRDFVNGCPLIRRFGSIVCMGLDSGLFVQLVYRLEARPKSLANLIPRVSLSFT